MRLYTRTGDNGTTGVPGGGRVSKTHLRIEVCGDLDELNASIGLAESLCSDQGIRADLVYIQELIFEVSAQVIYSGKPDRPARITEAMVTSIEEMIDRRAAALPPLHSFILPGGSRGSAAIHCARAVCRRAERTLVALNKEIPQAAQALSLVNRIADALFVLARAANAAEGLGDRPWLSGR